MGTEWAVAPPNRLRNQARILQWIALAPMGSRHGNCACAHKSQANASLQILSRKGLPSHFITLWLVLTWGYSIKSRLATSLHVLLKSLRISFISSLLHGGVQIIGLWGIGRRCYSSIRRSGSDTTRCGLWIQHGQWNGAWTKCVEIIRTRKSVCGSMAHHETTPAAVSSPLNNGLCYRTTLCCCKSGVCTIHLKICIIKFKKWAHCW